MKVIEGLDYRGRPHKFEGTPYNPNDWEDPENFTKCWD
jgi:hypothetical protein